jgi:UDPglucose 6-dehydrogenase
MEVNEDQKIHLIPKIETYFKNNLKGKKIALWGLAFKPNTDDIREAPALYIIKELLKMGATVVAYDPEAMPNVKKELGDKIIFAEGQYEALEQTDALIIATEWSEFRTPDFNRIKSLMKKPVIFDGRNLFQLYQMEECGFHYESVGRRVVNLKV